MKFAISRSSLAGLAVSLAALGASWAIQDGIRAMGAGASAIIPSPPQYIGLTIDPKIIRRLLGMRLIFADLIWVDTLIKSDISHEKEPFTSIYRAFKTVAELDPDNIRAYYVAGSYLSVIKDDVKGATAILREGARYMQGHAYVWDDAWRVPFTLGYNLLFEEHEIEEGAKWIHESASLPNTSPVVQALARSVETERGRLEIGARALSDFYGRVTRPEEKAKVEAKMTELASKQDLLDLNEKFEEFVRSTGAYAFAKNKQFQLFLRQNGHPKTDMLGRPLGINDLGKIAPMAAQ